MRLRAAVGIPGTTRAGRSFELPGAVTGLLMSLAEGNQGLTRAGAKTMQGPAGEAGPGGDPTLPLPARTLTPRREYPAPGYRRAGPDPRRHRARRLLRRLALTVVVLILLGILAFGGLLIITPSVGNAPQRDSPNRWSRRRTSASTPSPASTCSRSRGSASNSGPGMASRAGPPSTSSWPSCCTPAGAPAHRTRRSRSRWPSSCT